MGHQHGVCVCAEPHLCGFSFLASSIQILCRRRFHILYTTWYVLAGGQARAFPHLGGSDRRPIGPCLLDDPPYSTKLMNFAILPPGRVPHVRDHQILRHLLLYCSFLPRPVFLCIKCVVFGLSSVSKPPLPLCRSVSTTLF
jgi:hypothetical protein